MHRLILSLSAVIVIFGSGKLRAQEIDYVERFALAGNREEALKELIPGTEVYYYYHCLHNQNQQRFDRVEELLRDWIRAHKYTTLVHQIMNRQALLTYETNPQATLKRLCERLGLTFAHQRQVLRRESKLPSALDQNLISLSTLRKRHMAERGHLNGFEPTSFFWLAEQELDPDRRRVLLTRMMHPDFPNLPQLVVADLKHRGSRGFGSLAIHNYMLRSQLDECLKLDPRLLNQTKFVHTYIRKLHPGMDDDMNYDLDAKKAYLERLESFVRRLAPVHNSLKAQVLYHRLLLDRAAGNYDKKRFMDYVRIPRNASYINGDYVNRFMRQHRANLGTNMQAISMLAPIANDEPLVRSYLEQFFRKETSYDGYTAFIRDTYLKRVFAETKLLAGLGDPQQWYALMTPTSLQTLRERVDLEFAHTNPPSFGTDDPVKLQLWVKNVRNLKVKIYEINTTSYFRQQLQPINTNIELDGLVANDEQSHTIDESPMRRVLKQFEFPKLTKPGVYVIDFVGNGKSSRTVIRKGHLRYLLQATPAGPGIRVYDEKDRLLKNASVWIAGREYEAGDDGLIVVPFTAKSGRHPIILQHRGHAVLDQFNWENESYRLQASIFVDRESLVENQRAELIIRSQLYVNGIPSSAELLKDVKLTIYSQSIDGIRSTKVINDFKLYEDRESRAEFQVPPRLNALSFVLTAKVKSLSQNKDIGLQASDSIRLNQIHGSDRTQDAFFARTKRGFQVEVLGKSGVPRSRRPVRFALKHRDFTRPVAVTLQTNADGRIQLGELKGITRVTATDEVGTSHTWHVLTDEVRYASTVHAPPGEDIVIPYMGDRLDRTTVSLFEIRGGYYANNHNGNVKLAGGNLVVSDLPAGDFDLHFHDTRQRIRIRIAKGTVVDGHVLGRHRIVELRNRKPLNIDKVEFKEELVSVRLKNASDLTRVHVLATRYEPRNPLWQLSSIGDIEPLVGQTSRSLAQYVAGRRLGDEIQYILNRQSAEQFPGNMLTRPTLLLNPWAVRKTETGRQNAAGGERFADSRPSPGSSSGRGQGKSSSSRASRSTGFTSFDFLGATSTLLENLPVKNGAVSFSKEHLESFQMIQVIAVDPWNSVTKVVALDSQPLIHRDLRLTKSLPAGQPFAMQKKVEVLQPGDKLVIGDLANSRFELYGDLASLYRLYSTLNKNSHFTEFAFLTRWASLDEKAKRQLYSKYACHELHLFLFHRDRDFFDKVVRPYLANKLQPTFVDHWLLDGDLKPFAESWGYSQLNTLEKILLSQRIPGEKKWTNRYLQERVQLKPVSTAVEDRLFDSALVSKSLESVTGGIKMQANGRQDLAGLAGAKVDMDKLVAVDGKMANLSLPSLAREAGGEMEGEERLKAEAAKELAEKSMSRVRRTLDAKKKAAPAKRPKTAAAFKAFRGLRSESRRLYQKLDKTSEWAENNYYKTPIGQQNANLIQPSQFWLDFATAAEKQKFLSTSFTQPHNSFAEMVLALAVSGLPDKAAKHKIEYKDGRVTIEAKSPLLVVHEQIQPARADDGPDSILVSQNYFRNGSRYKTVNNQRVDNFVTDEFLTETVYGCQVVVTNPTSSTKKIRILTQIPVGAMPVSKGKRTNSVAVQLNPYNTHAMTYYFYFPKDGKYPQWPVHISDEGDVIASADAFQFKVVAEPSKVDTTTWDYVSQFATNDEVLEFLDKNNLQKLQLSKMAFRMRDKDFYGNAIQRLRQRHLYDSTLFSYSIYHNVADDITTYLEHSDSFLKQCGAYLKSPLVTIDPIRRRTYEHLEYRPLVNARAHQLGKNRKIVNDRFLGQYHSLLRNLACKASPSDGDKVSVLYYLLLQDRVSEALALYQSIDQARIPSQIQFDYFTAYLDFFNETPVKAPRIVKHYKDYPVERWRKAFAAMESQLNEIAGKTAGLVDAKDRAQAQRDLAKSEASLEMQVADRKVKITYNNIKQAQVKFYLMELELLFSRNPFVQQKSDQFSYIRPNGEMTVKLPKGKTVHSIDLPKKFHTKNVLVEVTADGKSRSQVYYSNALTAQIIDTYGQVRVMTAKDQRPLSRVYVKVFARKKNGAVEFYKDGYTDLRGRFDYTSLNTNELGNVQRFAILVMSKEHGALVREADPPRQ